MGILTHPGFYDFSLPQQSVPDSGPRPPAAPAPFPPGPPMMPPPFVSFMSFPGLGFSSLHPQLPSPHHHQHSFCVMPTSCCPWMRDGFAWVHNVDSSPFVFLSLGHTGAGGRSEWEKTLLSVRAGWGSLSLSLLLVCILFCSSPSMARGISVPQPGIEPTPLQ